MNSYDSYVKRGTREKHWVQSSLLLTTRFMWCTWRLPKIKCLKSSRGPSVLHNMLDRVIRISEFSMRRKTHVSACVTKYPALRTNTLGILLLFSSCSSLTCQWEFRICYCMVNMKVVWSIVHLHIWHILPPYSQEKFQAMPQPHHPRNTECTYCS